MAKKNQSEMVAAEAQAATVDASESSEIRLTGTITVPIALTIVVAVFEGTLDLVKKAYARLPEWINVKYIELKKNEVDLLSQAALAVSDESIPEKFVLVPAGTIPCGDFDLASFLLPTVYEDLSGKRHYNSGLPLLIEKGKALTVMESIASSSDASEEFAHRYIEIFRPRPVVVSFRNGNYVTPVKRANPCENVIIEAILRKKFLTSTPEGFRAMMPVLEKAFKDE